MLRTVSRSAALCRRGITTSAACWNADASANPPIPSDQSSNEGIPARLRSIAHELSVASELPIERRSLSRGLALNRFEKVNMAVVILSNLQGMLRIS